MTQLMTPSAERSVMTDGQIDKAVDLYRALLRKHHSEFASNAVQQVLGQPEYVADLVAVLRTRVEAVSNLIVRRVKVNRALTPQQVLDATGRKQYTDQQVVDSMPHGEGDEVDIMFFKPNLSDRDGYISDADLDEEYELRGLIPADPYSLAKVNEDDSAFADTKPNATHWKDSKGNWCFVSFRRWIGGERNAGVNCNVRDWDDDWWFAGLRKA